MKTVKMEKLCTTTVPMYALITAALSAAEREFNVEILPHCNEITEPKREGEYTGKVIPNSAEVLRESMANWCATQVPGVTFDFWKFEVNILEDPDFEEIWDKKLKYV